MGLKIKIISIGRVKQSFVLDGEAEFKKRLKALAHLEFLEIDSDRFSSLSDLEVMRKEAELFLERVGKEEYLVVLDPGGKSLSSPGFSSMLGDTMNRGISALTFAIGGALGWDESVKKRANLLLSLSAMTFPHQMTRLILVEQIYRALTILRGMPYHK